MKQLLSALAFGLVSIGMVKAQGTTTCPAPNPDDPNCFQTSRPDNGNPLVNWPPIPNQDCCNAFTICFPYNIIENGVIIPEGAPAGTLYPGCVDGELPNPNNTCFSNNEKGTTWYKFQIRPLNIPGSPTAIGSPAGKLRFKIIPKDVLDLPDYDPYIDDGSSSYGNTDFDFLLFKIPSNLSSDGAACSTIRNSSTFGTNGSVIASCNWSGTRGPTGLFEPGTGTEFAQGPATRFNLPLDVNVGDVFYLAIDNFSVNLQGFDIDFRGLEAPDDQTAIVNPAPSDSIRIKKAVNPVCADRQFKLIFDHPVVCDSVKVNKFTINGLLPNLSIENILPEGGCNPGGQDTSFVFTLNMPPNTYDTTLQLINTQTIRDICGNSVIMGETIKLRIEFPFPNYQITQIENPIPQLGSYDFFMHLNAPMPCDSLRPEKFSITGLQPNLSMASITPMNGCNPDGTDSIFVFTLSSLTPDTTLRLSTNGVINDACGNFLSASMIPIRIEYGQTFILQHPQDQLVALNSNVRFFVVTSNPQIPRKWQMNNGNGTGFNDLEDFGQFTGTSTDTLNISYVQPTQNNIAIRCKFMLPGNSQVFSLPAILSIIMNVDAISDKSLIVFPNPANGQQLRFHGKSITIFNLTGRKELSMIYPEGSGEISIAHLPNGIYFAEISDGKKVRVIKLLVNH